MKITIELASVEENGALIIVEGDDWIVAVPMTLPDNKVTIDLDELESGDGLLPTSTKT